jgi:ABC-type polysaccharide/polyol phosphate export permease
MIPQYGPVIEDIVQGLQAFDMWGRLGWRDTKRRYRRTLIGPFWTTLSLSIFVIVLGVVWSHLWNLDPKLYMPFLTSGMITWIMISTIVSEGCTTFLTGEVLIKQLRIPYTLLACTVVWRNFIVFVHNISIYVLVCLYAGVQMSWAMLLIVPGIALVCVNAAWMVLMIAIACARFRDIQQLILSIMQVAMFVTPIFWSPDQLRGRVGFIVDYNLLFHLVEVVRSPLMGRAPGWLTWVMVSIAAIFGWALTLYVYARFRRRIPYWL